MKLFDQISQIISKWFYNLSTEDKRKLIEIQDQLYQEKAQRTDIILQLSQQVDDIEAQRTLLLKEETTEDWKKKYTEIQIKSIIWQETRDIVSNINKAKFEKEKIEGKINSLDKYITALRDQLTVQFNSITPKN